MIGAPAQRRPFALERACQKPKTGYLPCNARPSPCPLMPRSGRPQRGAGTDSPQRHERAGPLPSLS